MAKRQLSYLLKSNLGQTILENNPQRALLPWTGDSAKKEDVQDAINRFKKTLEICNDSYNNIFIVSHSYGTVIAYRAIEELDKERNANGLKAISIEKFITLGSPLGTLSLGQLPGVRQLVGIPDTQSVRCPVNIKDWVNFWAKLDPISGEISSNKIRNIQVDKEAFAISEELRKKVGMVSETTISIAGNPTNKEKLLTDLDNLTDLTTWHQSYYTKVDIYLKQLDKTLHVDVPAKVLKTLGF